jgi:APA family basic amino acid/polyamine antiporter
MPQSGGEYNFLTKIFNPWIGFLAGWVSATVGFAAPIAVAAMALGDYTSRIFPALSGSLVAVAAVLLLTITHASDVRVGSRFQDVFTTLKVLLIVFFIAAGLTIGGVPGYQVSFFRDTHLKDIFSKDFAVSLFFVSYSYSGWNASSYIAGEIDRPERNLPRSLLLGTLLVTVMYVLLNFVFLYTTPMPDMAGKVEVGYIAAGSIFGASGAKLMGMVIALLLISSVSSMVMAGPRVAQAMGRDVPGLSFLSKTTRRGAPAVAIVVQSCITLLLIATASFDRVITYMGFTLNLFTMMTVAGVIVLRRTQPDLLRPSKMWGYPWTAILFLLIGLWILVYGLIYKPTESLIGLATVFSGLIVYGLGNARARERK